MMKRETFQGAAGDGSLLLRGTVVCAGRPLARLPLGGPGWAVGGGSAATRESENGAHGVGLLL